MLVIFGANGRTGREILREAIAAGMPVRPIARDDRDARGLDKIVDVQKVSYADADHPAALPAVLRGATAVISAISARTAGPGSPQYSKKAGANIVKAAVEAGIQHILHMSVVGAFRWSPNPLNRASFHLDREVRVLKDLPWTMMRVSCTFDEIIEGHVRPPDGGRPHKIPLSARYTPLSHRDVGRMVVHHLTEFKPSRTLYVGGPEIFSGQQLRDLVAPYVQPGGRRRTRYGQLPPGDVAVTPDQTRVSVSAVPRDRLLHALDPSTIPAPVVEAEPVYRRAEPGPHPSDQGRDLKLLRQMGADLRRVVHSHLVEDLSHLKLPADGVTLDFTGARARKSGLSAIAHEGELREMTGVRAVTAEGEVLHRGAVVFVRDPLAEELAVFWERDDGSVPAAWWHKLDMGVRRRLAESERWGAAPQCVAFREQNQPSPS